MEILYNFAKQEHSLSVRDSHGQSIRDQLNAIWRNTGKKPDQLNDLLELPQSCYSLWKWFIDLDSGRSSNGFGIDPISYSDILAYFQLIEINPTEEEVQILKKLDQIALNHNVEQMKKRNKASTKSKK